MNASDHPEDQSNNNANGRKRKICEHNRRQEQCKDCGGKAYCEHGRRRVQCKDCGGKAYCEHGKIRASCRDCGGKAFCEHGRRRAQCTQCMYFKTCHPCISKNALQKKKSVACNRNANITRERKLLENHVNKRTDVVLLGTKMLFLLQ